MLTGTGAWRSDEDEIRTTKPYDGAWKIAGDLKQIEFVVGTVQKETTLKTWDQFPMVVKIDVI